jgi:AhpD family alkylhydroperoxidase
MARLPLVDPETTSGRTRLLLDSIAKRRGRVTHMVRVLANSPAATNAFFSFNAALASGPMNASLRERIAIAIAQANDCQTCLAAHTEFGRAEGVSDHELEAARRGHSENRADDAALEFALASLKKNGRLDDGEIQLARAAGLDDALMLDILATVYINAFTNAVNHLAETEPDYPPVI